uniref:F-box domain-containing protein n=1 Tax=Elaeophora elaphi TaxID=1147741 RepID=A0A0R3S0E1_9BILA
MSALQDELVKESKGLLSLLNETIIRIMEKLSSEDLANLADTCIRLREVVRKLTAGENSPSYSIESIDESDCTCE